MSKPTASFDGNDLATVVPGLIVVGTTPYRFPNREVNTQDVAAEDKTATSTAYFKGKKINVPIEIGRDTRELLDESIDTLYGYLQGLKKVLLLSWASGSRQWNSATLANILISDVRGGHAKLDLEFNSDEPYGYETASTSLFSESLTGANNTTDFIGIVGGSADWQVPIITITFDSVTGATGGTVTVGNPANGQEISISRDWSAADELVIDSQNKTVKVNDNAVEYSGAIPEWAKGEAGSMDYSDDFTARTITLNGLYYKRYV